MSKPSSLTLRVITGLSLTAVVVAAICFQWTFYLVLPVAASCIYEMARALYPVGGKINILSAVLTALFLAAVAVFGAPALIPGLAGSFMLLFIIGILMGVSDLKGYLYGMLSIIYPGFFMSFLILMHRFEDPAMVLLALILSVALASAADLFAYFTGMLLGKRKLCPSISPKKTVAGAIGGFIGAMVIAWVASLIAPLFDIHIPLVHYLVLGALCGAVGQFGDLTASVIKRSVGIKDYAATLPGMGGFLDRIDSILFCGGVVYFYFTLILNI